MNEEDALNQIIAELEGQLADLKARLPAHSIPPTMIAELDERLADARIRLAENSPTVDSPGNDAG